MVKDCREIELINASVLPRDSFVLSYFHCYIRLSRERTKKPSCTLPRTPLHPLHRALSFNRLKSTIELRIHPGLHDAELRDSECLRPVPILLPVVILTSVRLWGERFRRHNNRSKQQRSQPNIIFFVVAIAAVALGRSLHFLSFPAAT